MSETKQLRRKAKHNVTLDNKQSESDGPQPQELTREEFLRVLSNVSRPSREKRDQGMPETSE